MNVSANTLHMSSVTKVDSWLSSSFVGSILKTDNIFTSSHLFFGEVSNVLISLFRAHGWLSKVVSLKIVVFYKLILWFQKFIRKNVLPCDPKIANKLLQSLSSVFPINRQFGMFLDLGLPKPLQSPKIHYNELKYSLYNKLH